MKIIMYFFPVMMIFFFNNYSSGLSYYYFISTLYAFSSILLTLAVQELTEVKWKHPNPDQFSSYINIEVTFT